MPYVFLAPSPRGALSTFVSIGEVTEKKRYSNASIRKVNFVEHVAVSDAYHHSYSDSS